MTEDRLVVQVVEEVAATAWPAAEVQYLGGWRLRHTHGVTRRANSAWPNHAPMKDDLEALIGQVESFYAARGLPARFQISPAARPFDLDAVLATAGYRHDASTAVQIADLKHVVRRTSAAADFGIESTSVATDDWFNTYCLAEGVSGTASTVRRAILQRISAKCRYILLTSDGEPVALGSGVVENGWLGIFNMTTRRQFRRRGAARAILHQLASWALASGASHSYLQVMTKNSGALSLYARAGFATLYHYHYREKTVEAEQLDSRG